jgi:hypothetical protein
MVKNPSQINGDNLKNLRRETKIIELETNNKNKNIRDL